MKDFFQKILRYLQAIIHLSDEIDYENASASIRKNIAFKGGYICENCINVFRTLGTAGRK